MAAPDFYHNLVKQALRKAGWRITHNPLRLRLPAQGAQTDEGEAIEEPLLAAEKDERKIAVAVRSFAGHVDVEDLGKAMEQLGRCQVSLHASETDCVLYLAVRQTTYRHFVAAPGGAQLLASQPVLCMVFDPRTEAIVSWNGLSTVSPRL